MPPAAEHIRGRPNRVWFAGSGVGPGDFDGKRSMGSALRVEPDPESRRYMRTMSMLVEHESDPWSELAEAELSASR
jgi:hypothetical protein